jgi:cell surface protein SprA
MGALAALIVALSFLVSFLFPGTNSLAEPIFGSSRGIGEESPSLENFLVRQDTTRRRQAGTLSRRARALEKRRTSVDTTDTSKSLARILEAIKALPRDSSARLAFGYVRRDEQVVNPLSHPMHSLYLPDPTVFRMQQTLDSSRFVYHVRRLYGSTDTRIPLDYTLEEYRDLRMKQTVRRNWEAKAHAYELESDKKKGLGDLFGSVTNIEIPVPKNPILSIFGPNIIRLQINGAVDIHAAFKNTKSDLFLNNPLAQSQSAPDFSQEIQVNVKGQIGDKLTIDADWNTQRQFEYENQLKVHYKGYDDDIIQSVEAGNVSLTTNSSFISSSSALFGIKAGFQFGPLKLTTVASQKKGQIKGLSVSGGGKPTPFEKRATDYSTDYYFIDTSYIAWFDSAYLNIPSVIKQSLVIRDMEVWVTRIGNEDPNERDVVAFMNQKRVLATENKTDLRAQDYDMVPGEVEVGRFVRLDPNSDYTYHQYAGYITLNRSLQPEQAIAVAYTIPDTLNPKLPMDVGNFGSRDTSKSIKLVMKLVRPQKLGPQYKTAWRLMMKNVYPLGGRGIKKDGFDLKILYEVPGKDPQDNILSVFNLLEVFGLDRYGEQPGSPPDGKFDYAPQLTINESRGELIFPRAEPFRNGIRDFFLKHGRTIAEADSFAFAEVYDTTFNGASNSQKNKFLIRGSTTSSMASTYQIGFNVVEGSVKVIVNGNPATLNSDYSVDYISGQVTIKNQALLVPGANLQIQYEANDLLQLASKSLLGARGELSLGKNTALGFTVMNLSQQSLSDKVRLGEEPISNTIFGFDGGTTLDLDFLTRAVNWLPGVQTNAVSNISIKGEAAYMKPNPNTRTSPISIDNGASVAYIDDFEGARKTMPLSTSYGAWSNASVPDYISTLDDPVKLTPQEKMEYKAKLVWYTIQPTDVAATQIWPNKSVPAGQDQVTVLNLWYRPSVRAPYNYSMDLDTKLRANPQKAWSGIQRLIGSTATNLLDENINFIELWVHLNQVDATTKLNIDLGLISEDVIPNNKLDTEDGLDGQLVNGILRPGEDLGLDGLSNEQEKITYQAFITKYPEYKDDPSGDDWIRPVAASLNPADYEGINGTENNAQSDIGRFPDTEDLNRNNNLDRTNSYYEYELSLDTLSNDFRQFQTGGNNGWYQVRIPLNGYKRTVGDPSFGTVEAIRVWLTGAQKETLIRIAEFNLVGNQWEELVKSDSTFRVSVVNIEDNPEYYSPPSLPRQRDPNQPDQVILLNEQSLDLNVNGVRDGESRQAIKRFPTRPLDLFSYRTMRMFVHGDERPGARIHYVDTTNYDLEVFLRFGSDSLNYYEYRAPIQPGWDPNNINISFAQLTAIKQFGRDTLTTLSPRVPIVGGPPGATYQVRGAPTLTDIRQIVVGVQNPAFKGSNLVTTEVWVNELRLTDVDNTPGWAYRFDTAIKIADVANVTFNLTQRDPNFHSLEDRFGTRNQDRNWALAASVGFERFLPQSWAGTNLSFSYSRTEQLQNPKYMPGTDILVDQAAQIVADAARANGVPEARVQGMADSVRLRTQTLSVSETYALPSLHLNVPVNSWLVTETINKLSLGYSFTRSSQRSPVTESMEQWQWNAKATYALTFSDKNFFSPFSPFGDFFLTKTWKDLKLFFSPRNFNLSTSFTRGQTSEQARDQTVAKPTVRNFAASRSMAFAWQFTDGGLINLGTDYALDVQSSLLNFETDQFGRQRPFSEIVSEMFGKSKLIDFGTDLNYGQTINFNPRILVPPILKLDRILTLSTRYSSRYDWTNNLQAGYLGKSAGAAGNASLTFDVNLKTLGSEIWSDQAQAQASAPADTAKLTRNFNLPQILDKTSRVLFKIPIFDFEKVSLSFTQQTRSQNSGVIGRPGFANLFGRVPFFQSSLPENGPSLMYQLGLASDPHGDVIVKGTDKFPFISGYTLPGIRAPNGNLVDQYSQGNNLTARTNRPLWEGASIELNWSVNWNYNVNKTIQSDSLGFTSENNKVVSGDITRSYLSFPSFLFFKFMNTSIEQVQKLYEFAHDNPNDLRSNDAKISEAFQKGLEALPFGQKFLGNLVPRPNWTIRWDGLEKLALFSSFATRISLDHSYTSGYKENWSIDPSGNQITQSQSVNYGFAPLIGLNVTFKPLLKGNFTTNFRYGSSTNYDLTPAAQNIVEADITDITITAGFSRTGFEFPFFGFSLSNDIDISFSYSYSKNARKVFDLNADNFKAEGTPLEGSSRTILEPRIRYILSSRVTASTYYKYTKLAPDAGGSRIPGSTTIEFGLDVRVAIQP